MTTTLHLPAHFVLSRHDQLRTYYSSPLVLRSVHAWCFVRSFHTSARAGRRCVRDSVIMGKASRVESFHGGLLSAFSPGRREAGHLMTNDRTTWPGAGPRKRIRVSHGPRCKTFHVCHAHTTYPRTTHARTARPPYPSPPPNNAVVADSSPTFPIIYLSLSPLEREKKTTTCVSPSLGKSTP